MEQEEVRELAGAAAAVVETAAEVSDPAGIVSAQNAVQKYRMPGEQNVQKLNALNAVIQWSGKNY